MKTIAAKTIAGALTAALLSASVVAAAPTEKKKGGGDTFIQLQTLTATITRANGRRGVLTVDVGLDIPDGALRQRASVSTPILLDAFTQALAVYAPSILPGAPPKPDIIGAELQRATDRTLGKPGARVLLGTILEN
jgi:flagellar basal body-associated protein FliL